MAINSNRPTNKIIRGNEQSYSQKPGDPLIDVPDVADNDALKFAQSLTNPFSALWSLGGLLSKGGIPDDAIIGGRHGLISEDLQRGKTQPPSDYNFNEPGGRYTPEWGQAMIDAYNPKKTPADWETIDAASLGRTGDGMSALDEYYQALERSARDNAAAAQQQLRDYADYGMAQLDADTLAFGEQLDEQEAAKLGLLQQSADQREEDYVFMVESMGGEEAAAQTYLADMGIRDPAAFTQEPLNETQALLGTSYRSGAEAGLQIQNVLNFAADQIQNINMSNMATSRANMLMTTAMQAQNIQRWLNDSLLNIEMKKLEGKIKDEEQARQNEMVAGYARALSGTLGLSAGQVIAADQFDLLDNWANQMWKPDEPQPTMINALSGQELPNQEVLDQLKAFQMLLDIQEQQMLNQELGVPSSMSGG